MQVNLVVGLIRSNQFEQASKEVSKISKDYQGASGLRAFFALKDKKYDEALSQVNANPQDTYSVFLKAQILLAKSKYFVSNFVLE
jgi:hypothetical protein